ncbi:MAG: alanine--tRNA ligase [Polyangiales bacterium]
MTPKPGSDEIRATFLQFFRERGHEVVASSGVVPRNDPTLLFTNAGMVQFKDVFLGDDKRPYKRAATSQKCVRMSGKHNDLDNVGKTARHHTFFEMLGNFSFGDYFKREAITFAWELLTKVYGIPRERLVVTVFRGEEGLPADDEARAIWREVTGFGDERIIGMGAKDNFWTMGDTGPCGPCTEIHYFMGDEAPDLARFDQEFPFGASGWMEIWNLVFMQFNRAEKGGPLTPLPAPCVDTGMGLERLTAVLQGVMTNYDTDLLRPLVDRAAEIGGKPYAGTANDAHDVACRVIADHARMAAFTLAEGVTPSNKDRGAALRSVMRRAIRFAYMQGVKEPSFHQVVARAVERYGAAYPELVQHRDFIVEQARLEDVRFRETIPTGLKLLGEFTDWKTNDVGQRVLPGAVAWELNATYGFPLDLTEVIGEERGFSVDDRGYHIARVSHAAISGGEGALDDLRKLLKEGRARLEEIPPRVRELLDAQGGGDDVAIGDARVRREHREALAAVGVVAFTGYDREDGEEPVAVLLKGAYGAKEWQRVDELREGDEGQVIVRATPFYGEAGGQVGDVGAIETAAGAFAVADTQKPVGTLVAHVGRVTRGAIRAGDVARLAVDREARAATRRNHSATHLLHWALRKVLGSHAQQKGSKVGPDALRFDYAASRALSDEEVARIEDLVNREVLANAAVRTDVTTQAEARSRGAMMIFEEKYGDSVRMLHIGSESVELCGGTHVSRTGDIGLFKVVADTNVGAGVRRVEAVTGMGAVAAVRAVDGALRRVAESLNAPLGDVPARVEKTLEHQRAQQKEIEELKRRLMTGGGNAVETHDLGDGATLVVTRAPVPEEKAMRGFADHLRDKHGRAVVVIGAATPEGKAVLLCAVAKELVGRFHAGKIVGALAQVVGGRGGGRPDMAGAGGPEAAKLDEALRQARTVVAPA